MARRILLFITDLEVGGTPTVVRELAVRLNDPGNGIHLEVACLAKWGPVADQLRASGITVTPFYGRGPRDLFRCVRTLKSLLREHAIDTAVSFLVHANAVAAAASMGRCDVRFFQSIQTTQPDPAWHWRLQRWIRRRAEAFIVPSNAIVENAVRQSGIRREQFVVIPNAIDPAEFPRHEVFKRPRVRIGFLGRLDPVKRVELLVDAMAELRDLPVDCSIYGYGPEHGKIEALVRARGLEPVVALRGKVARPADALAELDVLVLPSKGEGFGLVLIEAMASAVPVIASAHGGVMDVIQHDNNGLLVHDWVPEDIAFHVRRLMNDSDLRNRLVSQGLETVQSRYTWEVVLPQYKCVLGIP